MTLAQVIEERWKKIQGLSLKVGAHPPDSTFCVMEAVAFVAGEKWSDSPECACPIISAFLRAWNDGLPTDADRDRLLKALVPRLVGTRNKALEEKRGVMAADWLIRVHTPAWLRLAGLTAQADSLANLPEITAFAQFPPLRGSLEAIREDAAAAWAAARDAAWDAAGAAARDAAWDAARDAARAAARAAAWDAAWAAARDAAWAAARDAARDAAWDAARDAAWAAARDAAGAAAWAAARAAARDAARDAAGDAAAKKLAPTRDALQKSALELVERMIEARP
jgi:hypothetical protein